MVRSHLCDLLWDGPDDPRSELRWCLSKIRALVDDPLRQRLQARSDRVSLDLADCHVDALDLARVVQNGLASLKHAQKRTLVGQIRGEFLEDAEVERSPAFAAWLTGQRRRFVGMHASLLENLAANAPSEEAQEHLEKLLQIAPFDRQAHQHLLKALAESGRLLEGEKHLKTAMRSFDEEGLDSRPLVDAWTSARARRRPPEVQAGASPAPQFPEPDDPTPIAGPRRASIAVMPFADDP